MIEYPESDAALPAETPPTLDDAIEQCVLALERGDFELRDLRKQFPDFAAEIAEFVENWGGMESVALALAENAENVEPEDSLDPTDFQSQMFGDFELLQKIGVGGMGSIYKARQISLDRIVAVKMIRTGRADDGRFQVEAEAAAALSHPQIVSIYEVGSHRGRQFFAMQFIDGCNLKEYIDRHAIAPREAAEITSTISRAVHYAHQRGILHRDLKPANVLMDCEGRPYVTDFGLAKHIERDTELTESGTILGTPGYMAPEQASGKIKNLTTATDVYGLGALLYALLTGDAPFTGDSSLHILRRVVDEPATSPRLVNAHVGRDLETICLKCLEKSPDLRYHSAEDLANDLGRYLNHQPVMARPVSQSERIWRWCKRNPAVSLLSAAVLALMVATTLFAVFLAFSERNTRLLSQENNRRETTLNQELGLALERATEERTNLLMTNGLWQASVENVGEALLWFSEAADLNRQDPLRSRINLVRSQSWLHQHPLPVAATLLRQEYCDPDRSDAISFRSGKPQVLYRCGPKFVVWDYQRDEQWHLQESFPQITSALWRPDGMSLIVACQDGRVLAVDPDFRHDKLLFALDAPVTRMLFSADGSRLTVASGNGVFVWNMRAAQFVGEALLHSRPVIYMASDQQGDRLITVESGKQGRVFAVSQQGLDPLFRFDCHFVSVVDRRRPVWPVFIDQDRAILVRTGEQDVLLLDPATGAEIGRVDYARPAYSVAVSSDGSRLVAGSYDHAQHLRFSGMDFSGMEQGKPTGEKQQSAVVARPSFLNAEEREFMHDQRVMTVDISRQGLVATGGWNGEVRIWQLDQPPDGDLLVQKQIKPVSILPHQTRVQRVAFSPDGSQMISIQIDGLVRLWQVPDYRPNGYAVPVAAGGSLVKVVNQDHWITCGMSRWTGHMANATLHRIDDGSVRGGMAGQELETVGHLLDAACSPDHRRLATVHAGPSRKGDGKAGVLRFWSLPEGKPDPTEIPMPSEPRSVAFHPSAPQLAVCTARMELVIVDTETRETMMLPLEEEDKNWLSTEVFPNAPFNQQLAYSPDGSSLLVWNSASEGLWVWDTAERKLRFPRVSNGGWPVLGAAFSPDSRWIAIAAGRYARARILDAHSGQCIHEFPHGSVVHSSRFSPDGEQLVTACRDGFAKVYQWRSEKLVLDQLSHEGDVLEAVWSDDARFILTLGNDRQIRVWNASDGSLALRPLTVPHGTSQLLIAANSRYVIAAGELTAIRVFDLNPIQREPERDLETVRQISELLSNKTIIDGALVTLSAEAWYQRWQAIKGSGTN